MLVLINDKKIEFTKCDDGWYEADDYVINPSKTFCETSPWYADYICEAPKHEFTILNED